MNKKLLFSVFCAVTALSATTTVLARPQYVAATGASGCTACHNDNYGSGFKPGVLTAAAGGIAGLTAFINPTTTTPTPTPTTTATDTKPVLNLINSKWNVTVGETPLTIPFQVFDAENDTFDIRGKVPSGVTVTSAYLDNVSNLPTFNLKWTPAAAQAGSDYPISIYVRETGTGRTLSSNTLTANIKVWPARANAATAYTSQFTLQSAQWKDNILKIAGQIGFKSTATASQRAATLANLQLNVKSQTGLVIGLPLVVTPNTNGNWTKSLSLNASQVPCVIVADYDGLKAERVVALAPAATCIK